MKIPKAPPDLWRSIAREVSGRRGDESVKGRRSARCIAEWVITITPGGVEFAKHVVDLFRARKDHHRSQWMLDTVDGCARAAAALAIIYESGWQKHMSSADFYLSDEDALATIQELSRIEATIEEGSALPLVGVDRRAPTVIP